MSVFQEFGILAPGYTLADFLAINSKPLPQLSVDFDDPDFKGNFDQLPETTRMRAMGVFRLQQLLDHGVITEAFARNALHFLQTCNDDELIGV